MRKLKIGLTMGKFLPLHKGHELMLRTAAESVDKLFVLVGVTPNDPFTFEQRYGWIADILQDAKCEYDIIYEFDTSRDAVKDADGTITDEKCWSEWLEWLHETILLGDNSITHVFTSDKYGARVAKELRAEWYPVDPAREIVNITGTRARTDLYKEFRLLSKPAQKSLVKRIALVGPESVGKSMMVPLLGAHYSCPWVPEYGRTVCQPRKAKLSLQDFWVIKNGQQAFIDFAVDQAEIPLIITDTEALVTACYYELYYPEEKRIQERFYRYAEVQNIDLYLVLSPSVPWIQDGERSMTEIQRWKFYYSLLEKLREWNKPHVEITKMEYHLRQADCIKAIDDQISKINQTSAPVVSGDNQQRSTERFASGIPSSLLPPIQAIETA